MRLLLPREHGAWGVLLIPFLTTAAIGRRADAPVMLCLAAVFLLYLARHPLEFLLAPGRVVRPAGRFEIKRLGWSEVAHSLLFAALLILTLGLRS